MQKNHQNNKVLVELSGGVDSAITAYLLQQQDYDCIGVMMHLHDVEGIKEEINSAKNICKKLNIPFKLIDLRQKFYNEVIKYFVDTYKIAKTPNPCIMCNKKMKFGKMFEFAKELNCDKIATGHYAQILFKENKYELHCAKFLDKDQSYVLYFLNQQQLSKLIFPLGKISKNEVYKLAKKLNFACANKDESQDICFVKDNDYVQFIKNNTDINVKPGIVEDKNGNVLGKHKGLINYTIGQRKGLGLAFNEPKYVCRLNAKTNKLILGSKKDTLKKEVFIKDFSWILGSHKAETFDCNAKLRYRQIAKKCKVEVDNNDNSKVKLIFEEPVFAVTPGQFAVLYNRTNVLGGGIII